MTATLEVSAADFDRVLSGWLIVAGDYYDLGADPAALIDRWTIACEVMS
jgi:hypothetical protein